MKKLTGKRRYRSENDRLILQVEEAECFSGNLPCPDAEPSWRDATVEDLPVHQAVERG